MAPDEVGQSFEREELWLALSRELTQTFVCLFVRLLCASLLAGAGGDKKLENDVQE